MDVVSDFVVGSTRRKVHCIVSVESPILGAATWYTSQHSGFPL